MSMDQAALSGQVVLITGAGTGIGAETALMFAQRGARVIAHYHQSAAGAQQVVRKIEADGGRALALQADLTSEEQAAQLVQRALARFDRLNVLVNNAGSVVERTSLENCSLDLWRRAFDVNVTSAFLVTRAAIPALRAAQGCIINNLSLSVQTGGAGGAGPYAAAKGALQVMTRTLARELAPDVRVNAIMPGVIETPHHEQFSTPERMAEYRRQTPLGRNGTPREVASAIAFLASADAAFMSGALLDINGGRFLR
jgi:3-oxoacyl-[acyl-carrier protein] reductase